MEWFHRQLKDALQARVVTADWCDYLLWAMLGIRAAFHEDSDFPLAETVFGSQLVPPGQFVNTAESQSPSFLEELQTAMTGLTTPPKLHNSLPALITLPEELLLARFVLVLCDAVQQPLPLLRAGVSIHFFHLQIADRTDKVSTLHLKPARTLADTELATAGATHCTGAT